MAEGTVGRLDFGGKLDHDPDPGIFKGFFIYYCESYRQLPCGRLASVDKIFTKFGTASSCLGERDVTKHAQDSPKMVT